MRKLRILAGAFAVLALAAALGARTATAATVTPAVARSAAAGAAPDIPAPGPYILQNVSTQRCVDDSIAYGVRPYGCNGESFQEWLIYPVNSSGTIVTLKNLNTGRCLGVSSTRLQVAPCNGSYNQMWYAGTTERNGRWVGWFESTGSGCLDDSTKYGLRTWTCGANTIDDPFQTFWLN